MTDTRNTQRIQRASKKIIVVLQFFLIIAPVADCLLWLFINDLPLDWLKQMLPEYVQFPLPVGARVLGWCVSLLPLSLFMYANWILIRLFRLYEQGLIFHARNVRCFSRLSKVLIGWSLAGLLVDPLQSLALTLHHAAGSRTLVVSIGSDDITILLIGIILSVISWVMEEGRKIHEEQELTI